MINRDGENETKPSFMPVLIVLSQKAEAHGCPACHPGTFAVLFCDYNKKYIAFERKWEKHFSSPCLVAHVEEIYESY